MNLRLYIFKNSDASDYSIRRYIRFAVVDFDKSKKYPENFVCLLPLNPREKENSHSLFSKFFGDSSLDLAKSLLAGALKAESDSEIKAEIKKRLNLLEPKPAVQVRCRVCGKSFESFGRGRFKQRICEECIQKRCSNQIVSKK